MPPVPDSSSTPPSHVINDAETGLTALKQGDYSQAIARLENLPLPANHPLSLKANMGLVVAYTRTGKPHQAISLCQALRQHENPQVKEWATRTLENLTRRFPRVAETEAMDGGDRLEANKAGTKAEAAEIRETTELEDTDQFEEDVDLTGFVPFDGSSLPRQQVILESMEEDVPVAAEQDTGAGNGVSEAEGEKKPLTTVQLSAHVEANNQPLITPPCGNAEGEHPSSLSPLPSSLSADRLLSYQPGWRQAERAKQWNPLRKLDIAPAIVAQVGTAIALFWVLQQVFYLVMLGLAALQTRIPFFVFQATIPVPPVWSVLIPLVILFFASRWILDALLTFGDGLQPLSIATLSNYSPEVAKALKRYSHQCRVPLPALGVVPTAAPIAFSYGCLPRLTRLVVSQGLLEQLDNDEIAAVYASEIGHIAYRDVPLMSLLTVVNQIPYSLYRWVSEWGNRQPPIVRGLAIAVSAISYGLYSLTRWIGLWLSRQRVYYSDHTAADLTGNPNGFTRALLKIAIGTAKDVEREGSTSYLLEGFELLSPLGHRQGTTLGSVYPHASLEPLLEWEWTNPYRHWLALTDAHPPTGDRLRLLAQYARYWRLPTELDFNPDLEAQVARQKKSGLTASQWRTLLLQGAPFFGLGSGLLLAFALSMVGWVGGQLNYELLSWMYGDPTLVRGLPLVGFCLGTFIRINPGFPDINPAALRHQETPPRLVELLQKPDLVPVDSLPVQLGGKLLGRPGIGNLLSQDLLLKTDTGLIRLRCLSPWGPLGNLLPTETHFTNLLNHDLTATGWFRRGVTPWIDADLLRTPAGRFHRSNHPVWSTILGAIAAALGIFIIFRGGII
ncbi:M48 family metalloprotease [Leptothermofonsia sichuanensis E412]|uniref:M48 family metalloprotease n=1 Tax=Leptothermofonsia sichuanensis TaxID=2917832 RepID=UPI001CA6ED22|nr:M48 family metalloprotease [Leptothermofonsia sichuanensis]QZZ21037.1 M48 family metalloprotease [Leptothermofonsia sichuanensis E412]